MDAWYATAWDTEECVGSVEDDHVHVFVADVVNSFDTIDGFAGLRIEQAWATWMVSRRLL